MSQSVTDTSSWSLNWSLQGQWNITAPVHWDIPVCVFPLKRVVHLCDMSVQQLHTALVITYVVDGSVVATQNEEGAGSVIAADWNHFLVL